MSYWRFIENIEITEAFRTISAVGKRVVITWKKHCVASVEGSGK